MARSADIQVVLLRSGRTEWDEERRLQGRTDLPLSSAGHEDSIAEVRSLLADPEGTAPGVVYAAPDEACQATATLLCEGADARLRTEDDLVTMDLGLWEGLTEAEVQARFPSACRQWKEQPSCIHPPEGEPFEEARQRIGLALGRLLEKANGKPVGFVLRPLPYAIATCWLTGRPDSDIWTIIDDEPASQRLTVARERVRDLMEELKASA